MRSKPISSLELAIFYRQLAGLLKQHIPLTEAFHLLSQSCESIVLKETIQQCAEAAHDGQSLQECLFLHRTAFHLDTMMMSVWHSSSPIAQTDILEGYACLFAQRQFIQKLGSRWLVWPLIYLLLCWSMIINLSSYVLPAFQKIYVEMGKTLPITASWLLAISWQTYLFILCMIILVGLLTFKLPFRKCSLISNILIYVPWLGNLIKQEAQYSYVRLLAVLLKQGVSEPKAAQLALLGVDNLYLRRQWTQSIQENTFNQSDNPAHFLNQGSFIPVYLIRFIEVAKMIKEEQQALDDLIEISTERIVLFIRRRLILIDWIAKILVVILVFISAHAAYSTIFGIGNLI